MTVIIEKRELPFIKWIGNKIEDAWAVDSTGDWAADNAKGRAYANSLISYIQQSGDHSLLGAVVRAMSRHNKFSAIEVGFFTCLSLTITQ